MEDILLDECSFLVLSAIYGYSFCHSAKKAFLLIVANALRVATINSLGDFILFLGKLGTVAIVAVLGHEYIKVISFSVRYKI